MKNRIINILILLSLIVSFISCENEIIQFDSSKRNVAFVSSPVIPEEGEVFGIPVLVTTELNTPAVTVTFSVTSEGTSSAAIEGTDFEIVNSSAQLSYPNGFGYDTIWVNPLDNDVFTGDKEFIIKIESNSQGYALGSLNEITVVLKDNEHPLKNWLGTYSVDAKSYGEPGNWDEAWTVVTTSDPTDVNNLILTGIGGSAYSSFTGVVAKVDLEAMTITIAGGSEIGTHGNYGGPLAIFLGDEVGGIDNETDPMIGEIGEDGSIHIDHMAIKFVGGINTGYVWDSFDTYWTMNKSASIDSPSLSDKHSNLKQQ